jgi:uncharacterized membrane protein YcjF (UPF0283 family)
MNGWVRDFFQKNAWAIMLLIGGLVGTIAVMRADVATVLTVIPKVYELEKKQYAQEETNRVISNKLEKMDDKLDRLLRFR